MQETVTFRQPFWRWYLASIVVGQVLFALVNMIPAVSSPTLFGWRYFWTTAPFGAAMVPLFMVPAMLWYVRTWPVRVSPEGLRGSNAWGWPVQVSWSSISRVKFIAVPLFPAAKVYSTETHRVLWLPLFLNDYTRFAELVREYAGDGHPLTVEVMRRLADD